MDRETFLTDPGPCEWAKVFVPDKKYDDFGIDLILSPALAEAHQKRVRAEVEAWPNFNKLSLDEYHCHLAHKWVACWRIREGEIEIEVYYAGSRENAPY